MATTRSVVPEPPCEPKNAASPKEKIPPSDATSQYPRPDGVAVIPTIGRFNRTEPSDPKNAASPNEKIPPSDATSQYPRPDGVAAPPFISQASGAPAAEPASGAPPRAATPPRAVTPQYPPERQATMPTTSARIVSRCMRPPSPTHSQCHASGQALPPGSAQRAWFQPKRAP